jgi:hypothetical protein
MSVPFIDLVLGRRAAPSRRTATNEIVLAAILRDARNERVPEDGVRGFESQRSDSSGLV